MMSSMMMQSMMLTVTLITIICLPDHRPDHAYHDHHPPTHRHHLRVVVVVVASTIIAFRKPRAINAFSRKPLGQTYKLFNEP